VTESYTDDRQTDRLPYGEMCRKKLISCAVMAILPHNRPYKLYFWRYLSIYFLISSIQNALLRFIQEAGEMKRNIAFIQCSMQATFDEKLRQKATEL